MFTIRTYRSMSWILVQTDGQLENVPIDHGEWTLQDLALAYMHYAALRLAYVNIDSESHTFTELSFTLTPSPSLWRS